jgi:hypothetical protein
MDSAVTQVALTIDELVLNGFELTAADRAELMSAVSAELRRLLARRLDEGRIGESLKPEGNFPRLESAAIALSAPSKPDQLGAQIARVILAGLQR